MKLLFLPISSILKFVEAVELVVVGFGEPVLVPHAVGGDAVEGCVVCLFFCGIWGF